jgi:hypothetical protein
MDLLRVPNSDMSSIHGGFSLFAGKKRIGLGFKSTDPPGCCSLALASLARSATARDRLGGTTPGRCQKVCDSTGGVPAACGSATFLTAGRDSVLSLKGIAGNPRMLDSGTAKADSKNQQDYMELPRISGLLRKLSPRQEKVVRLFFRLGCQRPHSAQGHLLRPHYNGGRGSNQCRQRSIPSSLELSPPSRS